MGNDITWTFTDLGDNWQADWEGASMSVAVGSDGREYDVMTVQVTKRRDAPRPEPPEGFDRVVRNGKSSITLKHASTGGTLILLKVHIDKWCAIDTEGGRRRRIQEPIPFRDGRSRRTLNFARDVGRHMEGYGLTVKRCAEICHTTAKIVKEIDQARLEEKFGEMRPTRYSTNIAIDEFKIAKPRRFCTVVVDADNGELLYLEKGKGKAQALHFFDWVGEDFMKHVKAVSMDMKNADLRETPTFPAAAA